MSDAREVELLLSSLAFGGEAVGREAGGRVVFVAGGAPGDRVRARLVEEKRSFARAELVEVLAPGDARVAPPCPLADRCGGCPWMHVSLPAQLAAKQAIVARALAPSGAIVEPIVAAPAPLGYRTRARMTARWSPTGSAAIGFAARRSHEIVDVDACPALDPALDAALQAARRAVGAALGEGGTLAGLVARDAAGAPRVHLALAPGAGATAAGLRARATPLVGTHAIEGVAIEGAAALGAAALETGGRVATAAGFAQANAAQNETLRRLVAGAAGVDGARVLELYAGDGNFTRDLAARAAGGVAVEGDAAAVERLRRNLSDPRWELRAEPAARALARLLQKGARFDVVVLDPPRAGAAEVAADLPRLAPARIVYVSCDPMTLARDLATLSSRGYRATRAWPVDMMPHTFHIEVVCLIERA